VHEFLHSLGGVHEHTRPDRDTFVTIQWPIIDSSRLHNFYKVAGFEGTDISGLTECTSSTPLADLDDCVDIDRLLSSDSFGYDFNSVLHYGPTLVLQKNCDFFPVNARSISYSLLYENNFIITNRPYFLLIPLYFNYFKLISLCF